MFLSTSFNKTKIFAYKRKLMTDMNVLSIQKEHSGVLVRGCQSKQLSPTSIYFHAHQNLIYNQLPRSNQLGKKEDELVQLNS